MENNDLQQLVEQISVEFFGRPFLHTAFFNQRLRTTGGRYMLESHNIEINKRYLEEGGITEIKGIIKHELCHYHLHLQGKGYKHRDKDFKSLLKKVDGPRYCTPLSVHSPRKKQKIVIYKCIACHAVYKRKRKMNINKYVCGKCRGRLSLLEEKVMETDKRR